MKQDAILSVMIDFLEREYKTDKIKKENIIFVNGDTILTSKDERINLNPLRIGIQINQQCEFHKLYVGVDTNTWNIYVWIKDAHRIDSEVPTRNVGAINVNLPSLNTEALQNAFNEIRRCAEEISEKAMKDKTPQQAMEDMMKAMFPEQGQFEEAMKKINESMTQATENMGKQMKEMASAFRNAPMNINSNFEIMKDGKPIGTSEGITINLVPGHVNKNLIDAIQKGISESLNRDNQRYMRGIRR